MRTVLILGDVDSVQRALGELVRQAFAEAGRGPAMVLTATSDVDVLTALSKGRLDLIVADYHDDREAELLVWIAQGRFQTRTVLVTDPGLERDADETPSKGVDAAISRPATIDGLKALITEWFQ